MKNRKLLVTAVMLGLLAVILVEVALHNARREGGGQMVTLIRTKTQIKAGVQVAKEMLQPEQVSAKETALLSTAVPAELVSLVENQPAFRDVPANSILQWRDFEKSAEERTGVLVPPGHRAVALPVGAESAVGGLLRPGDHVDVYATVERIKVPTTASGDAASTGADSVGAASSVSTTTCILEDVEVLAVGRRTRADAPRFYAGSEGGSESTVTVAVVQKDVPGVIDKLHVARGSATLVLRPSDATTSAAETRPTSP